MIKTDYQSISEKESNFGSIIQVSRSLVIAENMTGAKIYELVQVGWKKQFGEIVKLEGDKAYIQCLENTTGLTIGDPVMRTMKPLTVELGPGLVENIFDGIQRPLDDRHIDTTFVPQDRHFFGLNQRKNWFFEPGTSIKLGMLVAGGDIIGKVHENNLLQDHPIMLPPDAKGKIIFIAPEGDYDITEEIIELEYFDKKYRYTMSHFWPIRKERPVVEKIWRDYDSPYITGLRFLDCLYPITMGGVCGLAGPFNSERTLVPQFISKYSNSDVLVHVGCGERSTEVYQLLDHLTESTITIRGRQENVMQKACLIANTPDMSLAAREASIYTGLTIAEYFRDIGLNTTLMVDSMSRWAEAVRETSNNLKELPIGDGYPAYLSSRIAKFFARAGVVKCLGSPEREGSITIIGTVSPPGGDYSDPVSTAIMENVQTFWDIDPTLRMRMIFPGFTWKTSFTKTERAFKAYAEHYGIEDPATNRKVFLELLQRLEEIREIVLLDRESLSEQQKIIWRIREIIYDGFLDQNVYSSYDYYCPIYKGLGMVDCVVIFYEKIKKVIEESTGENKITAENFAASQEMRELIMKLRNQKFIDLRTGRQEMQAEFNKCRENISKTFRVLTEEIVENDDEKI